MAPGVAGIEVTVTAEVEAALSPQVFSAVTETLPEVAPKSTVMDVVPWPEATVAPEGTVQVYAVAPATASML